MVSFAISLLFGWLTFGEHETKKCTNIKTAALLVDWCNSHVSIEITTYADCEDEVVVSGEFFCDI